MMLCVATAPPAVRKLCTPVPCTEPGCGVQREREDLGQQQRQVEVMLESRALVKVMAGILAGLGC